MSVYHRDTDTLGGQNKTSDSLELEPQTAVSSHVGASSGRAAGALNLQDVSPAPSFLS